jgi:hypothetical protein
MSMSKAIKQRAQEVLAELEKLPEDQRDEMYSLAVQAAKDAIKLASKNPMAAAVQLGEAQAGLPV